MKVSILLSLVFFVSCINKENLKALVKQEPIVPVATGEVDVNYCSLPAIELETETIYAFALDNSSSNYVTGCESQGCPTDPTGSKRYQPLVDWVNSRQGLEGANSDKQRYAMFEWADESNVWNNQADGVDDPAKRFVTLDEFSSVVQNKSEDTRGTPYLAALSILMDRVRAEALERKLSYEQSSDPRKSLSCFNVVTVFISDGFPSDDASNSEVLKTKVQEFMDLKNDEELSGAICSITINSAYYNTVFLDDAVGRLQDIADVGRGEFYNFFGNDSIDYDQVTKTDKRKIVTEPIELIAMNNNIVWSLEDKKYVVDSDGDGLKDSAELKSCVGKRDCDENGAGDGFESWLSVDNGQQCKDSRCDVNRARDFNCKDALGVMVDSDGDGIYDCEEEFVSSGVYSFDTNAIGIPDYIKFKNRYAMVDTQSSSDNSDRSNIDSDGDGVSDYIELKTSTPWQYHNELREEKFTPIKYKALETYIDSDGSVSGTIGLKCFRYQIKDITILNPNDEIKIYIVDKRLTGAGGDKFLRIGSKRLSTINGKRGRAVFKPSDFILKLQQ